MAKRGPKPQDPVLKEALVISRFNKIKELMEQGYPQYIACKKIKLDRHWIYYNFTPYQKAVLDQIYFSFSGGHRGKGIKNSKNKFF